MFGAHTLSQTPQQQHQQRKDKKNDDSKRLGGGREQRLASAGGEGEGRGTVDCAALCCVLVRSSFLFFSLSLLKCRVSFACRSPLSLSFSFSLLPLVVGLGSIRGAPPHSIYLFISIPPGFFHHSVGIVVCHLHTRNPLRQRKAAHSRPSAPSLWRPINTAAAAATLRGGGGGRWLFCPSQFTPHPP